MKEKKGQCKTKRERQYKTSNDCQESLGAS